MTSEKPSIQSSEVGTESTQATKSTPTHDLSSTTFETNQQSNNCAKLSPTTSPDNENSGSPVVGVSKSTEGDAVVDAEDPVATPESSSIGDVAGDTITLKRGELGQPGFQTWKFPWQLCRTWSGMHELIKQAIAYNPVALENIEKCAFDILDPEDNIIIPQVWESLAKPGWTVTIKLKYAYPLGSRPPPPPPVPPIRDESDSEEESSEDDKSDDTEGKIEVPSDKEEVPKSSTKRTSNKSRRPRYDRVIQHTVEFYHKAHHSYEPEFLYEKSASESITFYDPSKHAKVVPILQEVVKVTQIGGAYSRPYHPQGDAPSNRLSSKPIKLRKGDQIGDRSLIIRSILLLNALRAVINYSSAPPSGDNDSLKEGRFPFPYRDLCQYKNELLEYKINHPSRERHSDSYNTECDSHIDVLVEYLNDQNEIRLKEAEERWNNPNKRHQTTTFGSFWILMRSGSNVYAREHGQLNAYVIESMSGGARKDGRADPYTFQVWNLEYNGSVISRSMKSITIPVFDGERDITSLPLFPIRFHRDEPGKQPLRDQLIERGKKYLQLAKGPSFRQYSGKGLNDSMQTYESARVIINHKRDDIVTSHTSGRRTSVDDSPTYDDYPYNRGPRFVERPGARARVPGCQCEKCEAYNFETQVYVPLAYEAYDNIDPNNPGDLVDHQYFICASHLYGFILKDRIYDRLDVLAIVEPKINVNVIDQLVMNPETNKALLKAICKEYDISGSSEKPAFFADNIKGKGEGQIILLHGPPGTGKTLTAESVAEFTKRPLLAITAADLGHEPVLLEKSLLTFFRDANDWGAIVLLDEADVYLERRSTQDLTRNSIVSIFLRALDYFKGILFLTSNRVGSFDEAFMSRIHVQIGYDPLDEDARRAIWMNYFRKLKEDHDEGGREIRYEWDAKEYVQRSQDVRDLQWNGREIRNAFQTAVTLALDEAPPGSVPIVKESHFRQVVKMSKSFKDYIKSTHGNMDDADMAYDSGLRDDSGAHES